MSLNDRLPLTLSRKVNRVPRIFGAASSILIMLKNFMSLPRWIDTNHLESCSQIKFITFSQAVCSLSCGTRLQRPSFPKTPYILFPKTYQWQNKLIKIISKEMIKYTPGLLFSKLLCLDPRTRSKGEWMAAHRSGKPQSAASLASFVPVSRPWAWLPGTCQDTGYGPDRLEGGNLLWWKLLPHMCACLEREGMPPPTAAVSTVPQDAGIKPGPLNRETRWRRSQSTM